MVIHSRGGFTLIELSIVLVIIGLIVGGILVGQDLINAAKIRQQISQLQNLSTALNVFKIKYNAIPGDFCANAANAGLTACAVGAGSDNGIINDNNGDSVSQSSNGQGMGSQYVEPTLFFSQLVQAGLIENRFIFSSCAAQGYPGPGFYALKLNPTASMLAVTYQGAIWMYMANIANMATGCDGTILGPYGAVMTPAQAFQIDQKIDDGVPSTGNFYAFMHGPYSNQTNVQTDTTAAACVVDSTAKQYNVSNNTLQCHMLAKIE